MTPFAAVRWLWVAWIVSWFAAAWWSNRTVKRPRFGPEIASRALAIVGIALLFAAGRGVDIGFKLWNAPPVVNWCFVVLTAMGFAICWWARIHLGRMWSGSVTRKADHHVVDTGPYAWVRHPIYTGIIVAAAATAASRATPVAFAGWGLVIVGFWFKARLEERFLRSELGPDVYDAYARRTAMLLPIPPLGRDV